jgi:hypothetical protein
MPTPETRRYSFLCPATVMVVLDAPTQAAAEQTVKDLIHAEQALTVHHTGSAQPVVTLAGSHHQITALTLEGSRLDQVNGTPLETCTNRDCPEPTTTDGEYRNCANPTSRAQAAARAPLPPHPPRVLPAGTLPRLTAQDCTPTPFATAQTKADHANAVLDFIERGMPAENFTRALYDTFYLHLFGHIAHFDRHGFRAEWFTTAADKALFINQALTADCGGDPAHTWCDVENHLQTALTAHPHLATPPAWLPTQP